MRTPALLALALLLAAATPGLRAESQQEALPAQRYLVGLHEPPGLREGDAFLGATVLQSLAPLRLVLVETRDGPLFEARARLDDRVRHVEPDLPLPVRLAHVPNDPLWPHPDHWGARRVDAPRAWDVTVGGSVKVATLDTGLNKGHEEFAGQARVLQGWDFVNHDNDPADEGGALSACGWHGTMVAGLASATIDNAKGIAGLSQHVVLPVKVLGSTPFGCTGTTSGIVNGVKYAADMGAHVILVAWGVPSPGTSLLDAIDYAWHKGATFVAAAGNEGPCTDCVSEPWRSRPAQTLIVSATDPADVVAPFSSTGPQVDLAAPGVQLVSTAGGTTPYVTRSGTSLSAAYVAGAWALVRVSHPAFSRADVEAHLKATADDRGLPGPDPLYGHGILDAGEAVAT